VKKSTTFLTVRKSHQAKIRKKRSKNGLYNYSIKIN